jgi:hypothetical protein
MRLLAPASGARGEARRRNDGMTGRGTQARERARAKKMAALSSMASLLSFLFLLTSHQSSRSGSPKPKVA